MATTQKLINELTWREVDANLAPDTRRMLREERIALQAAAGSKNAAAIRTATAEALRVANMWGVEIAR